jgi:hypothetical protein
MKFGTTMSPSSYTIGGRFVQHIAPQSTSRSVSRRNVERTGLYSSSLTICLSWRPNEEERDHDTDDSKYRDWIEHCHITADKISQLPCEKISHNGSGSESGKDKPVIRPVVLGATKRGGACRRDREPSAATKPQGTEPNDIDARGTRSRPETKEYRGCCDNSETQHRRIARVYPVGEVPKDRPTNAVKYGEDAHQGGSGRCAQLKHFLSYGTADTNCHQAC